MKRLIDDPVKVVREDARVLALRAHRRVGDELGRLAGRAFAELKKRGTES